MDKRQWMGLTGAVMMGIGVFLPLVSVPVLGSMNYFRNGQGDGVIVLVAAGLAAGLALWGRCGWLWLPGGVAVGTGVYDYVKVKDLLLELAPKAGDNPLAAKIAENLLAAMQVREGLPVMGLGAALLFVSAFLGMPWSSVDVGRGDFDLNDMSREQFMSLCAAVALVLLGTGAVVYIRERGLPW